MKDYFVELSTSVDDKLIFVECNPLDGVRLSIKEDSSQPALITDIFLEKNDILRLVDMLKTVSKFDEKR